MNEKLGRAKDPASEAPKPTCFVITPIGAPKSPARLHADWVFHNAVTPACVEAGLAPPDRADKINHTPMITAGIFKGIEDADICIADLTYLNPNVFYELGIRHAIEKPVIHIAQIGTELPFDNGQHFTHFFDVSDYHDVEILRQHLSNQFQIILGEKYELSNPLTQARGRKAVAASTDSRDRVLLDLSERLERLEIANRKEKTTRNALFQPPSAQNIYSKYINADDNGGDSLIMLSSLINDVQEYISTNNGSKNIDGNFITSILNRLSSFSPLNRELFFDSVSIDPTSGPLLTTLRQLL